MLQCTFKHIGENFHVSVRVLAEAFAGDDLERRSTTDIAFHQAVGEAAHNALIGHLSAALCHLGNIACRVGRSVRLDPQSEQIIGDEEAARLTRRSYREGHWAAPKNV